MIHSDLEADGDRCKKLRAVATPVLRRQA